MAFTDFEKSSEQGGKTGDLGGIKRTFLRSLGYNVKVLSATTRGTFKSFFWRELKQLQLQSEERNSSCMNWNWNGFSSYEDTWKLFPTAESRCSEPQMCKHSLKWNKLFQESLSTSRDYRIMVRSTRKFSYSTAKLESSFKSSSSSSSACP